MRRYRANPRLRASLWLALKIETMDRQFFAAGIGVPGQLALDARLRATYPPPSTHRTPPGATLSLTLIHLSMQEAHQLRGPLRFGVFELDLRAGELRKNGLRVRLQEQPFQVLAMLVEHPGEVVGREELQKKLWPADTFVDFDHGLNKVINKIREALGDSAESPRFVQTVARRGYRFLAEVRVSDAAPVRRRDLATQPQPASEVRDRPDLASKLPTARTFSAANCVEDIGVRTDFTGGICLPSGGFISGIARPLSFAPWPSFRWKAFRAMRLRITSLTG